MIKPNDVAREALQASAELNDVPGICRDKRKSEVGAEIEFLGVSAHSGEFRSESTAELSISGKRTNKSAHHEPT